MNAITISSDPMYLGDAATPADVDALAARIRELCPGAEVRVLSQGSSCRMSAECPEEWQALVDQAYEELGLT